MRKRREMSSKNVAECAGFTNFFIHGICGIHIFFYDSLFQFHPLRIIFFPLMMDHLNIEFFRNGYGMLVDPNDKDPGGPVCFLRSAGGQVMTGYCNCRKSKKTEGRPHFSKLIHLVSEIEKKNQKRSMGEMFAASAWNRLATRG
jgi:hypothetical protein